MRKFKIAMLATVTVIILIIVVGVTTFKYYIVPKYVEPVLENVAEIVNDKEIQKEISQSAQEYAEKGLLDEEKVNKYVDEVEKIINGESSEQQNSYNGINDYVSEKNSVGAKNVKVNDDSTSIGSKYSYGKTEPKNNVERIESNKKEESSADTNSGESQLFDKVKSNMSSTDVKTAYELAAKLNMSTVRSLLSNRNELKTYIKSTLNDEEYSKVIDLYMKYSYLLK